MNTKIKLIYPTMICLLAAFLWFQACSTFEEELDSSTAENIFDSYGKIGVKHNEGLEYFFKDVKDLHTIRTKSGDEVDFSKTDYQSLAKESLIDFCAKNENFNTTAQLCKESLNNAWKRPLTKSDDAIRINSENRLSETDAIAIYAATSTAFSSYQYWKENHLKWMIALNYPELLELYSDDELNRFSIKNGNLIAPKSIRLKSWWDDAWGAVGEAWDTGATAMTDWWNNGGSEVVAEDAGGAIAGGISGGC
ncbi:MAG: hypothetical protein LBS25_00085 [Candidatus Symbiothrix sp.]|jgi:hypothetical protein|nr:hypothetical protein [Candidatus Symbiothrix sp.]